MWHPEAITDEVGRTLGDLERVTLPGRFCLAVGTGRALHPGHRRSVDLDFLSAELFDEQSLLQQLKRVAGFSLTAMSAHTVHAAIQGTKAGFLGYDYPVLFPLANLEGVNVADARDIACMKIAAIASRGAKRDFVDLYFSAPVQPRSTSRLVPSEVHSNAPQHHPCPEVPHVLRRCGEGPPAGNAGSAIVGNGEAVLCKRSSPPALSGAGPVEEPSSLSGRGEGGRRGQMTSTLPA